jgi:DNA-binding Lrp family transcriptional regulator
MSITEAPTASRTRTRTPKKSADRDYYVEACVAGRECIERLLAHKPKGTAAYKVTLALISQVTLWSRTSESGHNISTRKIAEMTGLDLRTVRRTMNALVDAGIISRISTVAGHEKGKGEPVKTGAIISMPMDAVTRHRREEDRKARENPEKKAPAEPDVIVESTPSLPDKFTPSTRSTPENEKKKKKLCEDVNLPSRASESGQSEGPASHAPGNVITADAHTPDDLAGLCDEAKRAHALALAKATALLEGVHA